MSNQELSERQKLYIALKHGDLNAASSILVRAEDRFYETTTIGEFRIVTHDIVRQHPEFASALIVAMKLGEVGRFDHRRNTKPKKRK